MVSTLKLTKIQIPNSDSDVLSFNSSTGVMTFHKDIQGEGTNTTNLQQGLAKGFLAYKGKSTNAVYDSNNVSTVTDNGTGDHTANFTNNYNGANDYAVAGFGQEDTGGGGRTVAGIGTPATSTRQITTVNASNTLKDLQWLNLSFHGDLA